MSDLDESSFYDEISDELSEEELDWVSHAIDLESFKTSMTEADIEKLKEVGAPDWLVLRAYEAWFELQEAKVMSARMFYEDFETYQRHKGVKKASKSRWWFMR